MTQGAEYAEYEEFLDPATGQRHPSRDTRQMATRFSDQALRAAAIDRYLALLAVAGEVVFLVGEAFDNRHSSSVPAGSVYAELTATITGLVSALSMTVASNGMLWRPDVLLVPRYLMMVLVVINMLEFLNGYGRPDVGTEFTDAAAVISSDIAAVLSNAAPVDWCGYAAERYAGRNNGLRSTVPTVADGDRKVAETLAAQAAQVEIGRQMFAAIECAVSAAVVYALRWARSIQVMMNSGATGLVFEEMEELKRLNRFGLITAFLAGGGLLATTGFLITEGLLNVHDFQEAKRIYQKARPKDASSAAGTAAAEQAHPVAASSGSGFAGITLPAQDESAAASQSVESMLSAVLSGRATTPAFALPARGDLAGLLAQSLSGSRPARTSGASAGDSPYAERHQSGEPEQAASIQDVDGATTGADSGAAPVVPGPSGDIRRL